MKEVPSQIKQLHPGDLVQIQWNDASIGKSLSNGLSGIDVPVQSWGIYIGVLGKRQQHIILAQNAFRYSDGLFDIDYTAVPVPWTTSAVVLAKAHVPPDEAQVLLHSFTINEKAKTNQHTLGRCLRQRRMRNH